MEEVKKEVVQGKTELLKFFEKKAELVKEGKEPKVSISKVVKVEFTKDIGYINKGHIQNISPLLYELYSNKKAVKKVD